MKNLSKEISKTVKVIKQEARTYDPPAIGYDALLEHGPISIWVDNYYPGDIEKLTEEDYWDIVSGVEDRLENWKCVEESA